jgi:hypothetical protein
MQKHFPYHKTNKTCFLSLSLGRCCGCPLCWALGSFENHPKQCVRDWGTKKSLRVHLTFTVGEWFLLLTFTFVHYYSG